MLFGVDLRALQLPRIVDVDRLPLREDVEGRLSRLDVAEHGRAVVETLVEPVTRRDLAAGQERRALLLADLRVRVDLLQRALVDHGADVGVVLPARAESHRLDTGNEPRCELVVDAF